MNPQRWKRIEDLYHAAREQPSSERAEFLRRTCVDDSDLRKAVEGLLVQDRREGMLDGSAANPATRSMPVPPPSGSASRELATGEKFGPYQIIAPIGKGGMGSVFKARDPRVDRTVAIKVSSLQFSGRFSRETHAVAALNHPHICTLYDVGPNYLVMEYVDGRPLEGPCPVPKAIRLAIQLLDALESAHAHGIVHRDLKPANILRTKSGIKVLDFGLAKLDSAVHTSAGEMTQKGAILGTLRYMSPEQVQGKPVDARSDLFSFGLVFCELLTGRRAFDNENPASIVAAILEREPADVATIEPEPLRRIVQRCLAKDPANRWQSAADLKVALEWFSSESSTPVAKPKLAGSRTWIAAAALLAAGGMVGFLLSSSAAPAETVEFAIPPPDGSSFADPSVGPVGYPSPDGLKVLLCTWSRDGNKAALRRLDSQTASFLPGTEGINAAGVVWAPDSKSFAFVGHSGRLTSISISGGSPKVLAEHIVPDPIAWGEGGEILASDGETRRIVAIPANGGSRRLLDPLDASRQETEHLRPQFLPGGRRYLYLAISAKRELSATYAESLDKPRRVLLHESSLPVHFVRSQERRWLMGPGGWLLTGDGGRLYAQRFDPGSLRTSGDRTLIADQVDWSDVRTSIPVSASDTGVMAISPPVRVEAVPGLWTRDGQSVNPPFPLGAYFSPTFSHDGKRIATALRQKGATMQDIWIFDLNGSVVSRLTTHSPWTSFPIWTEDDRTLYYVQTDGEVNARTLYRRRIDRPDEGTRIGSAMPYTSPCSLTSDGRRLLFARQFEKRPPSQSLGLAFLTLVSSPSIYPLFETDGRIVFAQLSPDDRFIVFASGINGQSDIYIQSSAVSEARRWRVSTHGGTQPRWSRDGREIFYLSADGRLVVVPVTIKGNEVELGAEKGLFTHPPLLPTFSAYQYDVSPKGDRFVFLSSTSGRNAPPLRLILNWESLARR
jgi:serine/threonine protein kinase